MAKGRMEAVNVKLDAAADKVLKVIDKSVAEQKGAYNVRYNGQPLCHGDSAVSYTHLRAHETN